MMNMPIRLIAVLPMLLLAAALIATSCESATQMPDDASQNNAIAAAAPTATSETAVTPEQTQPPTTVAQTAAPTETPALPQCRPGVYDANSPEAQACRGRPNPVGCPQRRIPPPMWTRDDGLIVVFDCLPPDPPPPVYPKLMGSLSKVAELHEGGDSVQSAARAASVDDELREGSLSLKITIDRDPKELVIWLNDNGALVEGAHETALVDERWFARDGLDIEDFHAGILQGGILLDKYISGEAELDPPYESGSIFVWAEVPVSLLALLSQQPGVAKVELPLRVYDPHQTDVPQEPQEPVTYTPTPRATSQGFPAHGVPSWHRAGYKGLGVKIGIIDTGFHDFRNPTASYRLVKTVRNTVRLASGFDNEHPSRQDRKGPT